MARKSAGPHPGGRGRLPALFGVLLSAPHRGQLAGNSPGHDEHSERQDHPPGGLGATEGGAEAAAADGDGAVDALGEALAEAAVEAAATVIVPFIEGGMVQM